MSEGDPGADVDADHAGEAEEEARPEWDDDYVDRVADRLQFNYDLERDYRAGGESFDLYGRMDMDTHKQFIHPAITYGHQHSAEHLFARRVDRVRVSDLERLVSLAHDLAETWVEPSEEHFSTDFVFVLVAEELPDDVRSFVSGFEDRTMLKYGYHGHYEVELAVVVPDREESVDSGVGVVDAFRLWGGEEAEDGFLGRLRGLF
ncbi:hypothetical protein [Halomarina litorea]|uniref:hypothetical protein n=1 Tax=Halomarina litorea TaxID=2961595 RepID=UPI0020C5350C|nr:hypothetical protein [Halomarina sp. BCD28]